MPAVIEATQVTQTQLKLIREIIADAVKYSSRVSEWEDRFLVSLRDNVDRNGERTFMTERQWTVFHQIERKIHAV